MRCDMCSRDLKLQEISVDGELKQLCQNCIQFGLEIKKPVVHIVKENIKFEEKPFVIENVGLAIMKKRNQMGLKQEELAMKVGIKVNQLSKIEANKIELEPNLVRRFEKVLGMRLV